MEFGITLALTCALLVAYALGLGPWLRDDRPERLPAKDEGK